MFGQKFDRNSKERRKRKLKDQIKNLKSKKKSMAQAISRACRLHASLDSMIGSRVSHLRDIEGRGD